MEYLNSSLNWRGIIIINGYSAFSDKGIASHEITFDEMDGSDFPLTGSLRTVEDRLKEAKGLYGKDLITYEEYQQKRRQIPEKL